jgi:hypothetical protein
MNKKLLAVAVAGAFAASGAAFANDHDKSHGMGAKVNGHIFSTFTLTDDFDASNEKRFHTDAELNIKAMVADGVYARVDLDYGLGGTGGDGIEQAYGAWRINDMAKLQIGRFNNPLGIEAHDQADLSTISHGLIRTDILNHQVDAGTDGNNIEGVAVHLMAGPAKVTLGLLNEIGGVAEENSFLLNISGSPIDGLDLALGVLTQEDRGPLSPDSYENLINFNVAYGMDMGDISWKVWLDYITAGEVLDNGYSLGGYVALPNNFGVTLRYNMIEYDGGAEDTAITLAGSWQAADNFDLRLEWRNDDIESGGLPAVDGDTITLAAAFKF